MTMFMLLLSAPEQNCAGFQLQYVVKILVV